MKRKLITLFVAIVGIFAIAPQAHAESLLHAFGLKGKVKTVTFDGKFTFAFDPDGNYLKDPNYNGGELSMGSQEDMIYGSFGINNYKWVSFQASGRFICSPDFKMTAYDQQNRPTMAKIVDDMTTGPKNIAITYSGSDSHGNYTQIKFATAGVKIDCAGTYIPETWNVKYEYWPDNATAADVPKPLTESDLNGLIQAANDENPEALTRDFRKYLEIEAKIPRTGWSLDPEGPCFIEGFYGRQPTLVQIDEAIRVSPIDFQIYHIDTSDAGDEVTVVFYAYHPGFAGINGYDPFSDPNNLRMIIFKYEDSRWRADDFADGVGYSSGIYYGDWRKNYIKERAAEDLKAIESGEMERRMRRELANDPDLGTYIKKIAEFKKLLEILSSPNSVSPSDEIFTEVEVSPMFPGGERAMNVYLSRNQFYPNSAKQNNIQGTVTVQFVVEKDGSFSDVEVKQGVDPVLDKAAVGLVKGMPKFIPGKMNGQPVKCLYTLPINYKLP